MITFTAYQKHDIPTEYRIPNTNRTMSSYYRGEDFKPNRDIIQRLDSPRSNTSIFITNPETFTPAISFTPIQENVKDTGVASTDTFHTNTSGFTSVIFDPNNKFVPDQKAFPYKPSMHDTLRYTVASEPFGGLRTTYTFKHDRIKQFHSDVAIPKNSEVEFVVTTKSFKSWIKDAGNGTGDGAIGNLEMTLEVYRLCEYRFKFPKNYLVGLRTNKVAYSRGDELIVQTREIGEIKLYTDKGSITIRTLPGMRINKSRLQEII